MSEMENKLNVEDLEQVTGGVARQEIHVKAITPRWVKVTASSLNCRYTPNGPIAKTYEYGHKLKVDGITSDGEWYRLLINDPRAAPAMLSSSSSTPRDCNNSLTEKTAA